MAAGGLPLPGPAEPNPFSFREFVRSKARGGEEPGGTCQVGPGRWRGWTPLRRPPAPPQLCSPLAGGAARPDPRPPLVPGAARRGGGRG